MLSTIERRAAYRHAHIEQVAANKKTWAANNIERAKIHHAKWRLNNPEKRAMCNKNHREKKQREFNDLFGFGSVIN